MTAPLTILELMGDRALVGDAYTGASWNTWRAVIAAAYGLPLDDEQRAIFKQVAGNREPPQKRVKELWCVVGRRGGKDSVAALIALHAALFSPPPFRRPGEKLIVMIIAVDRSQAAICVGYIKGLLHASPLLRPLILSEDSESIALEGGIEIIVAANSYRSTRGRTLICAIMDECAFYRSEDSSNPDFEVYNAILPGLATTGGMLIGISSPFTRSGLIFQKWKGHFGKNDDDVLVVQGASTVFNPTLDRKIIEDALARDPAAASAEWEAQWRDDIPGFPSAVSILQDLPSMLLHEHPNEAELRDDVVEALRRAGRTIVILPAGRSVMDHVEPEYAEARERMIAELERCRKYFKPKGAQSDA